VPHIAHGLCLDLADSFPGYSELLANPLKGMGSAVVEAEAHPQYFVLAIGECGQCLIDLALII
jgi:hypothetical protein